MRILLADNDSLSLARNKGAQEAKCETLIFLDDDTIIVDKTAVEKIEEFSKVGEYGYGAVRKWTHPLGRFEAESLALLDEIGLGEFSSVSGMCSIPNLAVRGVSRPNKQIIMQMGRTHILNFGYIKRSLFERVGGLDEKFTTSFEDLAFNGSSL